MLSKIKQHLINIVSYPHMSSFIYNEWKPANELIESIESCRKSMILRYNVTIAELEQKAERLDSQEKPTNEIRAKIEIYRTFINDLENLL